ncbi:MAG: hypothetical protein JO314_03825, partial [Acidobacteria bacterium]|nr:hypothetical protein [Acidobacteriota bacterium]
MKRGGRLILVFAIALSVAATARSQTRSLVISSEPGARVFIDGVLYGKTGKDGRIEIRS